MMGQVSIGRWLGLLAAALLLPAVAQGQAPAPNRVSAEKSGQLATRDGLKLRLTTDMGNVRVLTQTAGTTQVSWRVRVEADASQPEAQSLVEQYTVAAKNTPEGVVLAGKVPWRDYRGRVSVNYEVTLPRNYHLEVQTAAGNIRIDDVNGNVALLSAGGNLNAGHVGGAARLETQGGHITVQDVAGNLYANTQGGHVSAGQVQGEAQVRSGGGHISVVSVLKNAQLETAGGNITLKKGGASVSAATDGGRIDLGEATGAIRARTLGGGIRVVQLAGPTLLETNSGSIYLTRVQGAVKASTASGGITAWLAPMKLAGMSLLESGQGDILVYIPRDLAITIEASVEGGDHRIDPDPQLPLKVIASGGPHAHVVRAEASLNGGGELLRLKAVDGNIKLRFADSYQALYDRIYKAQMALFEKARAWEQEFLEEQLRWHEEQQRHWQEEKEKEKEKEKDKEKAKAKEAEAKRGTLKDWKWRLEEKFSGRVNVHAEEQHAKLVYKVKPDYPQAARDERIEGVVWLDAKIDREGKVEDVYVIGGHPTLARAAVEAVRQWRYAPTYVGDKPVAVQTVIRLAFKLD